MIKWIVRKYKMRKFYKTVKVFFFEAFENLDEYVDYAKRLYAATKDSNFESLKRDFIHELAGFAHEQAEKERESETTNN